MIRRFSLAISFVSYSLYILEKPWGNNRVVDNSVLMDTCPLFNFNVFNSFLFSFLCWLLSCCNFHLKLKLNKYKLTYVKKPVCFKNKGSVKCLKARLVSNLQYRKLMYCTCAVYEDNMITL